MLSPEQLLARLRIRWNRQRQDWLCGGGQWPIGYSTQPPVQSQAAAHWAQFDAWLGAWRRLDGVGEVETATRLWPQLGAQQLPVRWRLDSPRKVAAALGETHRWDCARERFARLLPQAPVMAGEVDPHPFALTLSRQFDLLADLPEADFQRLTGVLDWLLRHPHSGLFLRQLPIAGIDSKWLEPYRGVLARWLAALNGADPAADFYALTGLRRAPDRLRLRLLDPGLRARVGGLDDVTVPIEQIAALRLPIRRVVMVENLATGLAFDDLPGTALIMARGYAVEIVDAIDWLRGIPVDYWGDIDSHGFAILARLRSHLPQVRSLLMDEATLRQHQSLCVPEPTPASATRLDRLTEDEHALYDALRAGHYGLRARLEQERIAWDWAWPRIRAATFQQPRVAPR